jgi:hypothetical protein
MQDKKLLTRKDIMNRYQIKSTKSYELFHQEDFPSFRVGRKLLVREDKLVEWENSQAM